MTDKKYYAEHREELIKYEAKYRAEHRKEFVKYEAKYAAKHKEEIAARHKKYRDEHPEETVARHKKYYAEHREEQMAHREKYRAEHCEELATYRKRYDAKYYVEHREDNRKCGLRSRYNLTLEQYQEILDNQGGRCFICGRHQSEFTKKLHVDHDHITGKIRGLLCTSCNTALGLLKDNIDYLIKAIQYLQESA